MRSVRRPGPGGLRVLAAIILWGVGGASAREALPAEAAAAHLLSAQWQSLGGASSQIFQIDSGSGAGLFEPPRNGVIHVPLAVLKEARTSGDLRSYLAMLRVYRPSLREPVRRSRVADALLGLSGLLLSGRVYDRDVADPNRKLPYYPPSELDNFPVASSDDDHDNLRLADSLGAGGCEGDALAMLTRLSRTSAGRVANDARRAIRDLGMFAFHPSTVCDHPVADSFSAVQESLSDSSRFESR